MSFATATATRAEVVTLHAALVRLENALRLIVQGDAPAAAPGKLTPAQVDTLVTAVSAAITAVNA